MVDVGAILRDVCMVFGAVALWRISGHLGNIYSLLRRREKDLDFLSREGSDA